MKTVFILLALSVAVLAANNWRSGQPAPFPQQFTATFNETDLASNAFVYPGVKTMYYDSNNQRIRQFFPSNVNELKYKSVYYQIPGAEPGSIASKGYTSFTSQRMARLPNSCYFQSVPEATSLNDAWSAVDPDGYAQEYQFNFKYPQMKYVGTEYVPEIGIVADRWETTTRCILFQSGFGNVPCMTVYQTQSSPVYTVKEIVAHAAKPHSFDSDRYVVRVFLNYKPSVSDRDFVLPLNWQYTCGYADSGFNYPEITMVFADNANFFDFSLTAPPLQGLGGKVEVTFPQFNSWHHTCNDCIQLSVPRLTFDMNNWYKPQTVLVNYAATGCEMLMVNATGGGYDWQMNSQYSFLYFTACHLNPHTDSCKESNVCNNDK